MSLFPSLFFLIIYTLFFSHRLSDVCVYQVLVFELCVFCIWPLLLLPPWSVWLQPSSACMMFSCFAWVLSWACFCLSVYHHFTTVSLSTCLPLSRMSSFLLVVCLIAFAMRFPTTIQSQSSDVSSFQGFLCILCSLTVCQCVFTCNCLYFGDVFGV